MARFPKEVSIELDLDEGSDPAALRERVAQRLRVSPAELPELTIRRRGIDARRGRVRFHLMVDIGPPERTGDLGLPLPRAVARPGDVLIIGDGPAGLFCAHELARAGVGSTVVDRGKLVQPRRRDLKGLNRHGVVDPDSNYCFGEGGAGTYSDGKLYTRSDKRGNVRDLVETLARHGAPEAILTDARPHIGSNRLPKVVTSLRESLEDVGVRFVFEARVVALLVSGTGGSRRIEGVRLADGREIAAPRVVLATGHSARDVFAILEETGARLEAKAFAVGVRVEHPQPLINAIQYGAAAGHPALPAAAYALAHTAEGRGVFSFCMCPGGWIVPASTEAGGLVVNGMSLSRRNSPYANSGIVVGVEPADVERIGLPGPLGGVALQRRIEEAAWVAGGGGLRAPATRLTDFLAGRGSTTVPSSSYVPGLTAGDVAEVLAVPGLSLNQRLRQSLQVFGGKMRGFVTEEAVLVATESRTSAPVRVVRDPETLQTPGILGLYPAGEGAGYAGGIMSAAMDGVRIARKIVEEVH